MTWELFSAGANVVTRAAATRHDGIVPVRGSCMTDAPATEEEHVLQHVQRGACVWHTQSGSVINRQSAGLSAMVTVGRAL